MFGYVMINREELSEEAFARYRRYYCGLCRALQRRYGRTGQLSLSYDVTFLYLLLSSLYEAELTEGSGRCPVHPMAPRAWVDNEFSGYAADMSIELAWRNLLDKWDDDHSLLGRAGAARLQKHHLVIAERYPRVCSVIHLSLAQLRDYEQQNLQDPDTVSGCFGQLMAEVLDFRRDMWSEPLRSMGMALGKFIYLMDAYEDLPRDLRRRQYNPLAALRGQPDYEEKCHAMLTLLMSEAAAAFERLPILENADILRNILYSGVWLRYNALQLRRKEKDG